MPHLIVEYSANVEELTDVAELIGALHDAALDTGIASLDALRTRGARRDVVAIADRHPDNAFVAVTARLGPGRDPDDKQRFLEALMGVLDRQLGDSQRNVMLSVEYQEIDPDLRINKNNLRPVVAARETGDDDGR